MGAKRKTKIVPHKEIRVDMIVRGLALTPGELFEKLSQALAFVGGEVVAGKACAHVGPVPKEMQCSDQ